MNGNVKPRVVSSKKLDRMIDVSRRTGMGIYHGGSKVGMRFMDSAGETACMQNGDIP